MRLEAIEDPATGETRVVVAEESRLRHTLDVLSRSVGGVRTIAIGDRSGLPIVSLDRGAGTLAATAMATLALQAARNVCGNLDLPELCDVTIEGPGWKVFIHSIGSKFTLFLVCDGDVEPSFVKREVERHAPELRRALNAMA